MFEELEIHCLICFTQNESKMKLIRRSIKNQINFGIIERKRDY